jgi:hypothetical protein
MKQFVFLICLSFSGLLIAQSGDFAQVYQVFQAQCATCHNSENLQGNLDLEGTGATLTEKMSAVMAQLFMANPSNPTALAKGYRRVYPGRADRSFLFHKINDQLDPYYSLTTGEGDLMPNAYNTMTLRDRELIRQWILTGAGQNTTMVNQAALDLYFAGQGLNAFDAAPPAPAAGEGFQIKMGPFYLEPGGEIEYYQKWELFNTSALEVPRIDMKLSGYSHHFIAYHFDNTAASNSVPHGLRTEALHNGIGLTAAVQEATDLKLPPKTAFVWPTNRVLDLNSHYINYSQSAAYRAEVYVNVYTQPSGTAVQPMETRLYANTAISIPNTGNLITHNSNLVSPPLGNVWVWGLMGHTHKYGVGFKIGKLVNNQMGDLYYDAACPQGIPGCVSPYFDYQHIPLRLYEPLTEVNMQQGLRWQAQWINDGPFGVYFGPTSEDEMMVMIAMFVKDSTGLDLTTTGLPDVAAQETVLVPNPVQNQAVVQLDAVGAAHMVVSDLQGRVVLSSPCFTGMVVETGTWLPDVYTVQMRTAGQVYTQRLIKIE